MVIMIWFLLLAIVLVYFFQLLGWFFAIMVAIGFAIEGQFLYAIIAAIVATVLTAHWYEKD